MPGDGTNTGVYSPCNWVSHTCGDVDTSGNHPAHNRLRRAAVERTAKNIQPTMSDTKLVGEATHRSRSCTRSNCAGAKRIAKVIQTLGARATARTTTPWTVIETDII